MKLLTILFLLFSNFLVFSQDKIVIGTHYSPPWSNGDCTGAEIDVIKEAFSYSGISIECKYYSYARLVRSFLGKKIVFATPITKLDGDTKNVYYSDKFHRYVDVVIGLDKSLVSLNSMSDKRVVAYQGARNYLGDEYKNISKNSSYLETSDHLSQIEMLLNDRVDYVVGEKNILHHLAKRFNGKTVYTTNTIKSWDIRSASHNKSLMKKFNFGLSKMKKKGRVKEIFNKYKIRY